jgi:hypothetical protein
VSYALNKINSLEYVKLDYFTTQGCKEAAADSNRPISHDTFGFTRLDDAFAIRPLSAQKPSKNIRSDEDLSWEEMFDAKIPCCISWPSPGSGQWPTQKPSPRPSSRELHPRRQHTNGKKAP